MFRKTFALAAFATMAFATAAQAGDQIRIVGSSTVYPFATAVAEQFGKTSGFKTPVVESTGTGGGLKLFCAGNGPDTPSISDASRRITQSEIDNCAANGVKHVAEVVIGYDGIVVAQAKGGPKMALNLDELYRAMAKTVPVNGKLVANPYKKWSDINPKLPKEDIVVFGPASNHGTRDAVVDLIMDKACEQYPVIKALAKGPKQVACDAMREDGAFIEVSENYTVTLQKLLAMPSAVGILTYSYLDQNGDKIQAATIDGQIATYDNIASGKYPLSRPLFFYVKTSHVGKIPGIKEYIAEFTSEKAWGKDGYLAEKGLIAAPDAQRKAEAKKAKLLPDVKL